MSVHWLLALYPRSWRARYGKEFLHVLERQTISIGVVLDVVAGAIDARLHRDYPLSAVSKEEGAMFCESVPGSPGFGASLTQFAAPILVLLAYVALWLSLTALWGETPATAAFQYAGISAVLFISWGIQGLRLHSHPAKALVMVLALAVFYGISFAATWLAYQI